MKSCQTCHFNLGCNYWKTLSLTITSDAGYHHLRGDDGFSYGGTAAVEKGVAAVVAEQCNFYIEAKHTGKEKAE